MSDDGLDWDRDGHDWPGREASRFVRAGGLRWHVQCAGVGPVALLVHGTGAATHSWRDLAPRLARDFRVIAPDLPGHGFSSALPRGTVTLPAMAGALGALLEALGERPALVVGHSAGAAVLAELCLAGGIAPRAFVSLNGALLPPAHLPMHLFMPLARLFAATALVPRLVAWGAADPAAVARLVASTGSRLDARGVELYARLVRCKAHVAAVLDMMAGWDLGPLARRLPSLAPPLLLVAGGADRTVPPVEAERVAALVPGSRVRVLAALGHLAHEEAPDQVARLVAEFAAAQR